MVFFTSDQHFYHSNIVRFCKRPYANNWTMETELIRNYNQVVGPDDTVFFLGDFAFTSRFNDVKQLLDRMYGKKILIRGNHDRLTNKKFKEAGFAEVYYQYQYKDFLLVHAPVDNYFDCLCICGHVHHFWKVDRNNINVSVDVWDYKPVSERMLTTGIE